MSGSVGAAGFPVGAGDDGSAAGVSLSAPVTTQADASNPAAPTDPLRAHYLNEMQALLVRRHNGELDFPEFQQLFLAVVHEAREKLAN